MSKITTNYVEKDYKRLRELEVENADLRKQLKDSVNEQGQLQHVIDLQATEVAFLGKKLAEAQQDIKQRKYIMRGYSRNAVKQLDRTLAERDEARRWARKYDKLSTDLAREIQLLGDTIAARDQRIGELLWRFEILLEEHEEHTNEVNYEWVIQIVKAGLQKK